MNDTNKQTYIELRARVDGINRRLAEMREILENPNIHDDNKLQVRESVRFWSRSLGAAEARLAEFMRESGQ